jgi:Flp pilus assembly protein TadG
MFQRKVAQLRRDHRGAALVEMTVLLPFLLALGCGVFEFGAFFYNYQLVEAGVRDAARYMARVTDTSASKVPCDPAVLAAKVANAKDIAVMGVIGGTTPRVSWWAKADVTVDYATVFANPLISGYPSYRGPLSGIRVIKVTTSPTYPGVGFLSFLGLGSGVTISLNHQERCMGEG